MLTMSRAILIPAKGTEPVAEVDLAVEDFDALAEAIGSRYVEFVRILDPNHYMVVDETGRLTGGDLNRRASLLYPDIIVGDVLIVGWNPNVSPFDEDTLEIQGTDLPLDEVEAWLLENQR